jgi:succinate dehydrogenase/fumarate reductase flavoprotein subunit
LAPTPVIPLSSVEDWDDEADVVVAGSGASGMVTAVTAAAHGARVIVAERAATLGGTTAKSDCGVWVPNSRYMREHGIRDDREAALRYMARVARPALYHADAPFLGLDRWEYQLIAAYFDSAASAFDELASLDAMHIQPVPDFPDNYADLPENEAPTGRFNISSAPDGTPRNGRALIDHLALMIEERDGAIRTSHRVRSVVMDDDRVIGVVAQTPQSLVRMRARGGVVFATGGFAHNAELRRAYLKGPVLDGCSALTNEGDFVAIAQNAGAALRNMTESWWAPVVLERVLRRDPTFQSTFGLSGDSMLCVNRHGRRAMNEKVNHHDAVAPMLVWDGTACEYPNQLLFVIWDERSRALFGGAQIDGGLMPAAGAPAAHVMEATTIEGIADAIADRLAALTPVTGGARLASDFTAQLRQTIERFNEHARAGHDPDFHRGESRAELHKHELLMEQSRTGGGFANTTLGEWNAVLRTQRPVEGDQAASRATLFPLANAGPYFATIIAPGVIDTKGGPMTDINARVLDHAGNPVAGLYAVGNCAAAASAEGSWAAGATLGPMITFAWLAGRHVAATRAAAAHRG